MLMIAGIVLSIGSNTTVTNVQPDVDVKEVEQPDWMSDEEAVEAAKAVIERKEWEANKLRLESNIEALQVKYEADMEAMQLELDNVDKQLGVYWKDEGNVKRLIRKTFPEEPNTAVAIGMAESQLSMVQSEERYQEDKPHWGVKEGDQELSFCYFQIHAPAHEKTAQKLGLGDYKTNPESCIKMARVIYDQAGGWSPWSVYQKKMHLAYVR